MKKTLTKELLQLIQLFGRLTKVTPTDIIEEDGICYVIVPQALVSKAIGKQGVHVKTLAQKLKKKVKVVGKSDQVEQFVSNLIHPLKVDAITLEDSVVTIQSMSRDIKAQIIGRSAKHLNTLTRLVQRYFPDITSIKVE